MSTESLRYAVQIFGAPFVGWTLNAPVDSVLEHSHGERRLDERQLKVLDALMNGAVQLIWAGQPRPLLAMLRYRADRQTSVANAVRLELGGRVPDVDELAADPVARAIAKLAIDIFPAFLVEERATFEVVTALSQYPGNEAAIAALADDVVLRALVAPGGGYVTIEYDDKSSRAFRRWELVAYLLASAADRVVAVADPLDPQRLCAQIAADLDDLRRLLAGEEGTRSVLVGLSGITLEDNYTVDLGALGVLRPAQPQERRFGSPRRGGASAILMRTRPETITARISDSPEQAIVLSRYRANPDLLAGEHAAFCAVLAVERDAHLAPAVLWASELRQLDGSRGYTSGPDAPPARPAPESLTGDEIAAFENFAAAFATRHDQSLDVSVRRLLSSLNRQDGEDALIDAVMVWENITAVSAEVSFRVAATMAVLLRDDPSERRAAKRSLSAIYDLRSKIVHGARPARRSMELADAVPQATTAAVSALRRLYRDYAALLGEPEQRSNRLIFGDTSDGG